MATRVYDGSSTASEEDEMNSKNTPERSKISRDKEEVVEEQKSVNYQESITR